MKRLVVVCLSALLLCGACLTQEELDCWYDDWCKDLSPANVSSTTGGR